MVERVFVVSTVADEQDIIQYTISHWLSQGIDGIIIANNMSVDNTDMILNNIESNNSSRVMVVDDMDPAWYQGRKMTSLAYTAHHEYGADIVIPCDADELWYSMDEERNVSDMLRDSRGMVIGVPMWNHFCTNEDEVDDNPFKRMVWRSKDRNPLDKVCYRYNDKLTIDEGNHRILAGNKPIPGIGIGIGIRHFPYRGADHFCRKAERGSKALAAAKELNPTIGLHWRQYGESLAKHGAEALKEHYRRYFAYPNAGGTIDQYMVRDPAPYRGDL